MPTITLTTEQVRQAQNEEAARGLLPKECKKFAHSGELYSLLDENPVLFSKYQDDDGNFDPKALRNAMKQAIKNTTEKAIVAGGTFPELSVSLYPHNGDVHVMLVNDEVLREQEAAEAASDSNSDTI